MSKAVVACAAELSLSALPCVPRIQPGDDLAQILCDAIAHAGWTLEPDDVLVVTSKLFSRAQGRWVDLSTVEVTRTARELGDEIGKDPALVQCILDESTAISRKAPGVLIVRHRLGFVSANAGIDASNARPADATGGSGPWVLLLPRDPDTEAQRLRERLTSALGVSLGIVISDSFGRPFRFGTVGAAIGVSGLPPLWDQIGRTDLDGRPLEHTITALADQVAAAADLVAGQADEGRPVVRVRGLRFEAVNLGASALSRPVDQDLYA